MKNNKKYSLTLATLRVIRAGRQAAVRVRRHLIV